MNSDFKVLAFPAKTSYFNDSTQNKQTHIIFFPLLSKFMPDYSKLNKT